tara:strand:- start:202 stop:600 length:399 start_codon:yes stop_codon:yes gene_type:complete
MVKKHNNYAFLDPKNINKRVKNIEVDHSLEGEKAFLDLTTDYFQEFGLSDDYKKEINLRVKLIKLNCDYSVSGDRNMLNTINYYKGELDKLKNKNTGEQDNKKEMAYVASKLSRSFNDKEMSIFEYYNLLNS